MYCWGPADSGQGSIPADLAGPVAPYTVAVGASHSCAGSPVRCWSALFDQAGSTDVPKTLGMVYAVYAGEGDHSCAIKMSDRTLECWGGANTYGERTVPTNLGAVRAAAVGRAHTCALKSNGTLVCFGNDTFGQATVPSNLTVAIAVAAADDHTCALNKDGLPRCWGGSSFGEAPPAPAGVRAAESISTGPRLTCTGNGDCWEAPDLTQLPPGLGPIFVPSLTDSSADGNAFGSSGLVVGSAHACAINGTSNNVRCWASSSVPSPLKDDYPELFPPDEVANANKHNSTVVAVAASDRHTCAAVMTIIA